MNGNWKASEDYVTWLHSLYIQKEPETCMAYSICNAASMINRKLKPQHLLDLWEERGLCISGSMPITQPKRALKVASSYFREAGVQCEMTDKFRPADFPKILEHQPTTPCKTAHIVTLGPAYMRKYHNVQGVRIPKRRLVSDYEGPGHDVLALGLEGLDMLIFDPDPQLKNEFRDNRFSGLPVVLLEHGRVRNYFTSGDHARTLTTLSPLLAKPHAATRKKQIGEMTLELEGD